MKREKLAAVFFAGVMAIGLAAATNAMALLPNCSVVTPVTEACGWVISAPGCFKLENSLTATTDAGDCIQIISSNVYLDLNRQSISGTGATSTGNGVHVLGIAAPITNVAVQGGSINGFQDGVFVETTALGFITKVRLDNILSQNNNHYGFELYFAEDSLLSGLYSSGNSLAGLGIEQAVGNHVSNSTMTANLDGVDLYNSNANTFSGVTASFNGFGFVFNHSNSNQISSPFADSNSFEGIWLAPGPTAGSSGNTIAGGHANSNGRYGVWVEESSANQISGIELNQNGEAGIYLGCDGPTTATCTTGIPSLPKSNSNGIDANFNITTTGSPAWGIAIDKGNLSNTIVGNTSSANTTLDEYDGNKCGVSNWFANTFGTSSAPCVH